MEDRGEMAYKDLKGTVEYIDSDGVSRSHYGTVNFGPNTVVMIDPQSFTDGSEGFRATIIPYHRVLKVELSYTMG